MSNSSDEEDIDEVNEEELSTCPEWIRGNGDFTDFDIHPQNYDVAAVDIDGCLNIYKVEPGQKTKEVLSKRISKRPCRCTAFTNSGDAVFVTGKSGSFHLFSIESEKYVQTLMKGESPPYCILVINQNLVACGDDDGTLKVWDIRKGSNPIIEEDRFHDYISCLSVDKNGKFLFATSGDGTMSTFNIRRRKFMVKSENAEYDMTSVTVAKKNKKVVVGTSEGLMLLYNWEEFAAPSDRFPGHPMSIECLAAVNENIVCTGSLDGMIRAVHILPNRFLGVLGDHHGMPVSQLAISKDQKFIASRSDDSIIRFWSVDHLHKTTVDANAKPKKNLKSKKLLKSGIANANPFVSDLDRDMVLPVVESHDTISEDESYSDDREMINPDVDS